MSYEWRLDPRGGTIVADGHATIRWHAVLSRNGDDIAVATVWWLFVVPADREGPIRADTSPCSDLHVMIHDLPSVRDYLGERGEDDPSTVEDALHEEGLGTFRAYDAVSVPGDHLSSASEADLAELSVRWFFHVFRAMPEARRC